MFIDPEMADLAALLDGPAAPSITNTPARDVRALFAQMAPKGEAAGCAVTRHEQHGALHAFLTLAPASTAADVTLDRITTFIDANL